MYRRMISGFLFFSAFLTMIPKHRQTVEFQQLIMQSKDEMKWQCARLVYNLVKDALSRQQTGYYKQTLYEQSQWIFKTRFMKDILDIAAHLCPRTDLYTAAACIARQNNDEEVSIVLTIAAEEERLSVFKKYRGITAFFSGLIAGYWCTHYFGLNEGVLRLIK
ncbi:hypothetical protein IPH25_00705 [bacterium]|nr:MAG: hypothetical protein IPG37_02825 [bacterium]QQR61949.1 MAG: hypothetical protein IPH25_00705 [bacterium]QQR62461.1 MAG: hypothetical protein IPH67_03475 [bacterium]